MLLAYSLPGPAQHQPRPFIHSLSQAYNPPCRLMIVAKTGLNPDTIAQGDFGAYKLL